MNRIIFTIRMLLCEMIISWLVTLAPKRGHGMVLIKHIGNYLNEAIE